MPIHDIDAMLKDVVGLNNYLNQINKSKLKLDKNDADQERYKIQIKLFKEIIFITDNFFGDLHDLLDTLEYYGDERYDSVFKQVNELEDNITELVEYLRSIGEY